MVGGHSYPIFPGISTLMACVGNDFSDFMPAMPPVQKFKLAFDGGRACAIYLVLALLAAALVAYATPFGLVIFSGDSMFYVEGARNLLAGHGYSAGIPPQPLYPIVTFPPLYSIVIAGAEILVRDPYAAARWVSIFCFAGSVFLLCLLVWRVTGGNFPAGLAAGLIFFVNPDLLGVFTKGFSETIFIPLGLAGQIALVEFAIRDRRGWLIGAALCMGLAAVARYSGLVWIAAGICTLLLCARGEGRAMSRKAFLFLLIAMLPTFALTIRNRMVSDRVAGRKLILHPISMSHFREGLETISSWFLPWRLEGWLSGLAVAGVLAILTAIALWRSREPRFSRTSTYWVLTAIFCALYFIHLPLAISLVGYDTAINDRILAPVEVCAIASLGVWFGCGRKAWPLNARTTAYALTYALLIFVSAFSTISFLKKSRENSGGYRGPVCRSSPLYQTVLRLPENVTIYSNKPEAIYLSVERPVSPVPLKNDPMNLTANEDLPGELAKMGQVLKSGRGVIVYLLPVSTDVAYRGAAPLTRLHEFSEAELKAMFPLQTVIAGNGAEVLKEAVQ